MPLRIPFVLRCAQLALLVTFTGVAAFGCGHSASSPAESQAGQGSSQSQAGFRFEDVAQQAGLNYRWSITGPRPIDILQGIGNGCAFLDYDDDGNLDILLVGPKLALYKGDGHGHFTDVTHQTGLDRLHGNFLGCAVGDFDNDGYPDIYLTAYKGGALLHNDRGRGFTDITAASGIQPQPWGSSAAWVDIDGDGKPDLYIGNYVDFGPHSTRLCHYGPVVSVCTPSVYKSLHGVLYKNIGGGKFRDVTADWHVDKLTGPVLGFAAADFDGSGHQGIYVGNDLKFANLLKSNGSIFTDIGRKSGTSCDSKGLAQSAMGVDWGDYDNDGRLDLTVGTYKLQPGMLYHNEGHDLFTEQSDQLGIAPLTYPYLKFGEKWADLDNTGWLDLVIANGHVNDYDKDIFIGGKFREPTQLLRNADGVLFQDASQGLIGPAGRPIVGRGLAIGDYDNDGKVDILVVDSDGSPLLLHNETPNAGHWLELDLVGTKSNRDGEGALVTVVAGGHSQLRLCTTSGSYMSASDKRVHIGLADAVAADSLSVRWPSGYMDTYKNLKADRLYTLQEGRATPN